jgi:uncharacterized protein YlxW (UPF0749 family)
MNNNGGKFIIMTALVLLGIGISMQFRSNLDFNRQKAKSAFSVDTLKASIGNEIAAEADLKNQIENNQKKRDEFLKSYLKSRNDNLLLQQWENARLKAGLTDVEGPGLIIKLDDAAARKDEDPMLLIIHDSDIKIIINDLKKAGAQAISINGERLGPVSEQVCAGPTIRINKNRYAVPYVINVVGNPEELYESMIQSERVALMLRDNIRIDIKKYKSVLVTRFSNPERYVTGMEVISNEG